MRAPVLNRGFFISNFLQNHTNQFQEPLNSVDSGIIFTGFVNDRLFNNQKSSDNERNSIQGGPSGSDE